LNSKNIRNLIFDLGNVVLNIDTALTLNRFAELLPPSQQAINAEIFHHSLFIQFEKGLVSAQTFRADLRQICQVDWTDAAIDEAWNALILDFPPARIQLLKNLQKNYRLFLLSNTNEIHQLCFEALFAQSTDYQSLEHLFEKVYYSHYLGKRKPEVEIYEQVLQENHLQIEQTVLLDDNWDNVVAARAMGMTAVHIIPTSQTMLETFEKNALDDYQLIL
jgi:putative hydrolase of the HAD superfamily